MLENINSGAEYAQVLINSIKTTESSLSVDEKMDPMLLECLYELIINSSEINYSEYIVGNRESFLLDDIEMAALFRTAHENYVQKMLNSMVDKDLLEVSINEEGEFLYGLSDKGKEEASRMLK